VPEDFMSRILGLTCTSIVALGLLGAGTASAQGFGAVGGAGSGYYWQPGAYDFVDISVVGTTIVNQFEDQEHNVAMPFAFPYYGNSYSTVRIGGTGGIGFFLSGDLFNGNDDLPDTGNGSHDVAAFWDSLDSDFGDLRYWHDAANNRFIISWDGIFTNSGGTDRDLTFQIHLHSNGAIEFHYQDVVTSNSASLGARATIGLQDVVGGTAVTGGNFIEFGYNSPVLANGMAIRWGNAPGAVDADNDGVASAIDCDDTDPNTGFGTDADADYFPDCAGAGATDCDDATATTNPGAIDVCTDGEDNDCNGYDQPSDVDGDGSVAQNCGGDDCDDNDATLSPTIDADADGFSTCDPDCDDTDPLVFPGAPEICDGIDQNCDGVTSEEADADGDGFATCAPITGQLLGGDCDDTDSDNFPGGNEFCDGQDNDCNGVADDVDVDGDGFTACLGDCDDNDATVNPAAVEVCDGADVDGDCDGLLDSNDLDIGATTVNVPGGSTGPTASGPTTYTLAVAAGTGTIGDVNVTVDISHTWDGDLEISITSPAGTSVLMADNRGSLGDDYTNTVFDDEAASSITTGSPPFTGSFIPENPLSILDGELADGTWTLTVNDTFCCNPAGNVNSWELDIATADDADGDGSVDSCGDCNDADATIFPGAEEVCDDGIIQDCDLAADPTADADADGEDSTECGGPDCDDTDPLVLSTTDADADLVLACDGDCDDSDPLIFPGADETTCDGIDSDCDTFDGVGDDGTADIDGDGETFCGGDCDDLHQNVFSTQVEICNGIDNDCDGTAGIDLDLDGSTSCGDVDCDDNDAAVNPDAVETCDGNDLDEDCDGLADGFDLDIGALPPLAELTGGTALAIPDCCNTPLVDTVTTAVTDPVVAITVEVDITHTWDGDLEITLTSPTGTDVILADNVGSLGDNFTNTVLDDAATTPIASGSPPFTGTFQPSEPLAGFVGEVPTGTWTLTILDSAGGDTGTLNSWSMVINPGSLDDADGDGNVASCGDCDDTDATIFQGAPEICGDGIIQDCDLAADPVADEDVDADGFVTTTCGGTDCDDNDATINPGAAEVCNDAIDNDCDATTDDLFDDDLDGDLCDTDCDDANPLAYNGFFEICDDGIDNDCDVATLDLGDNDGDGTACDLDCDDTNANIFPGAAEVGCDALDNDCDPTTADDLDADGDTFLCSVDCDDADAAVNPAAAEVVCDGIDNDCDPTTVSDADADNDGAGCDTDCDDNDPAVAPGLDEVCDDGVDNDCDPLTADIHDADLDGDLCDTDCADNDPLVFTGAPEVCADGIDQDCDGVLDEAVDDAYALDDDGSVLIGLCGGTVFPFCGTDHTTVYVQSNGRLTFGFDDTDHTENVNDFTGDQLAFGWTDLNPALNQAGSITITEDAAAGLVDIVFADVPEAGDASLLNSFTVTLWDDGTSSIIYGTNSMQDGLVGFSCGDGTGGASVAALDLSDVELIDGQAMIGQGTEDAIYEIFTETTNPNDLADESLDLCLTAGDDLDGDGWTDVCGDCDDDDITSFPGAEELCDGIDNDCNGVDDDPDADGDTYIDINCNGDDCDDEDDTTFPGAPELCDGVDNDCDGAPEEGSEDDDMDGVSICAGDCDDSIAEVHGGDDPAVEVCDLLDNDCDGTVDNDFDSDVDGDGSPSQDCGGEDCDDRDPDSFPGGEEVCDQADNDCNDVIDDVDADGDGHFSAACGGLDCDDDNAEVHPEAEEIPYDEIDNDCSDGDLLDVDGDGYQASTVPGGTDCDDNDDTVNPGALENGDTEGTCSDAKDNNCDGAIDVEDELCSACENCNASYTGEGPMGTAQMAFALLMVLGVGLRRRRD